jgi:hypothetical protein
MAKLDAAERKRIPSSEFGLPGSRKYPMEDKNHAKAAKSRASKEEHAGKLSKASEEKIDRKADRVLGQGAGGAGASKHIGHESAHKHVVNPKGHHQKLKHE